MAQMKKTYYLIDVRGGVEPFTRGSYLKEKERDEAAKIIHRTKKADDSLFWADVDEDGGLVVGSYVAGFFCEEYEEITD